MKARGYFWSLSAVMLVALAFLTAVIIKQGFTWYFIVTEVLVLLVLVMLFFLYKRVVKPLQTIGNGMDLLREQDFSSRLGYVGQKDADKVVDIFNNMMGRLKDEKLRIREQNRFLDLLIKSSPMGVVITGFDDKIAVLNPAACVMFGVDEGSVIGLKLSEIGVGNAEGAETAFQLPQALSKLDKGESSTVRTLDGNTYKCTRASFLDRGFHHPFYLIEQMTEELLKAEKKAYGQVIRMISHEVNNSMAGVASSLDTAKEIFESGAGEAIALSANDISDIRELLSISSERCVSLSNFITAFANVVKIPEPQFEKVNLNDFIDGRLRFFESVCSGKNIKFETALSPSDSVVDLDPVLMEQVLVNIIKNAAESIEDEGIITMETITRPQNREVALVITDNGQGISSQTADKLFTPFFSTKANGQGIGLTLIRDILLKHKCRFSLSTGSDGLTRFTIVFCS